MRHVMITYRAVIHTGPYGDQTYRDTRTKRGFYSAQFENYTIPHAWTWWTFNGKPELMPGALSAGSTKLEPSEVISWEYAE